MIKPHFFVRNAIKFDYDRIYVFDMSTTNITHFPPELLARFAGDELQQIATFRAALPKRLWAGFNANICRVLRCYAPRNGFVHVVDLRDFFNLREVRWYNDDELPLLPASVEHLDHATQLHHVPNKSVTASAFIAKWQLPNLRVLRLRGTFVHDVEKLATHCPLLEKLHVGGIRGDVNLSAFRITTFISDGRNGDITLPGTITKLRAEHFDIDSIKWSYKPRLIDVNCKQFSDWKDHPYLEELQTQDMRFSKKEKYAPRECIKHLRFPIECTDYGINDPQPDDSPLTPYMYYRSHTRPSTAILNDMRIVMMKIAAHSTITTFPSNLRKLEILMIHDDISHLPATLESLSIQFADMKVCGRGLTNLKHLSIVNAIYVSIKTIMDAFPDSIALRTLSVRKCDTTDGMDRAYWDKYPRLQSVKVIDSCSSQRLPIRGRYIEWYV